MEPKDGRSHTNHPKKKKKKQAEIILAIFEKTSSKGERHTQYTLYRTRKRILESSALLKNTGHLYPNINPIVYAVGAIL